MIKRPCAHFGCNVPGTFLLCVNVPGDDPLGDPATVVVDLTFCERHIALLDPVDALKSNPQMRAWFATVPGANLAGAYISGLQVGSEAHLEALMQAKERDAPCHH